MWPNVDQHLINSVCFKKKKKNGNMNSVPEVTACVNTFCNCTRAGSSRARRCHRGCLLPNWVRSPPRPPSPTAQASTWLLRAAAHSTQGRLLALLVPEAKVGSENESGQRSTWLLKRGRGKGTSFARVTTNCGKASQTRDSQGN